MHSLRPTWAEIDIDAIAHNINQLRGCLKPATKMMAVVKANAYGHGTLEVARVCAREGLDFLGVAVLDEALGIRRDGIDIPVLILGFTPPEGNEEIVEHEIRQTVFSREMAESLSETASSQGKKAYVHIKIDTGMSRIGFPALDADLAEIARIFELPNLVVEGIFTHLAMADSPDRSYTEMQLHRFESCLEGLTKLGVKMPIVHAANTAGTIEHQNAHFDMVRAGIGIYGLKPSPEVDTRHLDLIPAMRLKSSVVMVKEVPPSTAVSYGCTYVTDKRTRIATVPVGYGDGYTRLYSDRAWAAVNGQRIPLIGRVCMDHCMFDVTDKEVELGDEVILFGRPEDGVTADDLAQCIGTINYEVVCLINSRVPRIYVNNGKRTS